MNDVASKSNTTSMAVNGTNGINKVSVVLGAQFGDEGKGKLVDMLCQKADFVCRCQVIITLISLISISRRFDRNSPISYFVLKSTLLNLAIAQAGCFNLHG